MEVDTFYNFLVLQTGSSDGGIFFEGLILLPVAFLGLIVAITLGSITVKSRVKDFNSAWATAIAIVSALAISSMVRALLTVPPIEVELVTVSSTMLFPLGVAVQRQSWISTGIICVILIGLLFFMTHVFPNTSNEVIPLTLGAGLIFFALGHILESQPLHE